jgi:hypothetical protein
MIELQLLNDLDGLDDLPGGDRQRVRGRLPHAVNRRLDPLIGLTDAEFKSNFRFDKDSVVRLVDILNLERVNNRGRPLTPVQQVCLALNFYAGGHFTRIAGLCGGVSQKAAWLAIERVTNQLVLLKDQFIHMPTDQEMEETATRLETKFKLPRFAFGIDGVVMIFDGAPRKIPAGTVKQDYWHRKMRYAINVQVIGNDKHIIYDINADWQGCTHDSRIWRNSMVKRVIERQRRYLLAGDSGYPISENLMTPYRVAEALANPRRRLFNRRLSGLRTVCTENIFGIMKRRWPRLTELRCNHPRGRRYIIAIAILHNIAIRWNDVEPVGGIRRNVRAMRVPPELQFEIIADDAEPAIVRARGQQLRDQLCANMPP